MKRKIKQKKKNQILIRVTNFISFYNDCMLSTSFFRFTKLLKDFIKFFRKHLGMHPFLVAVGDVKKENY